TVIGNYDYGFYWYLYQDGTIQLEVKLTGVPFVNAESDGAVNPHATQVGPGLVAPYHQHLFCARLDMDIDAVQNTVVESDVVRMPVSEDNHYGNAFTTRSTVIGRESEAGRMADPLHTRTWMITSTTRTNRLGQPSGYKLVPQAGPVLLAADGASV